MEPSQQIRLLTRAVGSEHAGKNLHTLQVPEHGSRDSPAGLSNKITSVKKTSFTNSRSKQQTVSSKQLHKQHCKFSMFIPGGTAWASTFVWAAPCCFWPFLSRATSVQFWKYNVLELSVLCSHMEVGVGEENEGKGSAFLSIKLHKATVKGITPEEILISKRSPTWRLSPDLLD